MEPERKPNPARAGLYPALLKHWRAKRGSSQLDLALAAGVSSRHLSFLETGRSVPSLDMVLRLASALDVPLRHVNAMARAAGYARVYPEPGADGGEPVPDEVARALALMKAHHEPFPLLVLDRAYDIVDLNRGALALLGPLAPTPMPTRLNLARLTFAPAGRDALVNFDAIAPALLWRIQREVLAEPDHGPLRELLAELLALPNVAADWREANLGVPASPVLAVHLRAAGHELRFLTMVTALQAPQTVALDDLRIESWFPIDAASADACRALAGPPNDSTSGT